MTQSLGAMSAQPTTARAIAARAINNVLIMAASLRLLNASLSADRRTARPMRLGLNAPLVRLTEPDLGRSESIHAGIRIICAADQAILAR